MHRTEEALAASLLTQWADRADRSARRFIRLKPSTARKFASILLGLNYERHKHERAKASYAGRE